MIQILLLHSGFAVGARDLVPRKTDYEPMQAPGLFRYEQLGWLGIAAGAFPGAPENWGRDEICAGLWQTPSAEQILVQLPEELVRVLSSLSDTAQVSCEWRRLEGEAVTAARLPGPVWSFDEYDRIARQLARLGRKCTTAKSLFLYSMP